LTPLTLPTLFGTEKKMPRKTVVLFDEPLEFKQMLKKDLKFINPMRPDTERDVIEGGDVEMDPLEFLDSFMEMDYEEYFAEEQFRKLYWTDAQREDEKLGRTGRYCIIEEDYAHAESDRFEDFSVRRTVHNDNTAVYTWPTKVVMKANEKNVLISTLMNHRFRIPELIPIWPTGKIEMEAPSNIVTRVSDIDCSEIADGVDEYGGSSQQGQLQLLNEFPFVQPTPNSIGIIRKQPPWEPYERNPFYRTDVIAAKFLYNQYFDDVGDWFKFRDHVRAFEKQHHLLAFTDGSYHRASNIRPKLPSVPQNYEILNNIEREELDSIYRNVANFATRQYGKRKFTYRYSQQRRGLRRYKCRRNHKGKDYYLDVDDFINYPDEVPFDEEIIYPPEDLEEIHY
jgi:hypothetical protein